MVIWFGQTVEEVCNTLMVSVVFSLFVDVSA